MFDQFQESLTKGDVSVTKEGYELKFLGKSYATYLTSTETQTVVVPDLAHNGQLEGFGEPLYRRCQPRRAQTSPWLI